MKKHVLLWGILLLCLINVLTFSQSRFGTDSRLTDIIVYVGPNVVGLPERQSEVPLSHAVITVPELAELLTQRNAEMILRSFPDADPSDTVFVSEFGQAIHLIDRTRVFRLRFPKGENLDTIVEKLNIIPGIIFAYQPPQYELDTTPNDYWFPRRQWHFNHTGQYDQPPVTGSGRADIRAVEAWSIYKGSSSVKIGIMDTGVRLNHPDLSGKVVGDNWTNDSHGTHVAGIAGAKSNNTEGIAGLDWHASIVSKDVRYFDPEVIYTKITSALNEGVHVLNNSWSGVQGTGPADLLTRRAFVAAYKANVVAVATMGNTGIEQTRYPGAWPHVIAVGATNHTNEKSGFSTWGDHIDVVAPGGWSASPPSVHYNIWSTYGSPNYQYNAGTSMAAPQVTGLSSLLRGYAQDVQGKTLYNDDIRWIIRLSSDKIGSVPYVDGWNNRMGYGRINARKALDRLNPNLYSLTHAYAVGGTSQGASGYYDINIYGVPGLGDIQYVVKRHEVRKNITYTYTPGAIVWCRGVATTGWADEGPNNFSYGWCEPLPGTVTNTTATLRTYVYEVYDINVNFIGWYPSTPANVRYEYTIHGIVYPSPPSLSLDATGMNPILNWNAVGGAGSYNIYRGTVQGSPGTVSCAMVPQYVNISSTSRTTFTDLATFIDPNSNTLICYYVTTVSIHGESDPSNKVGVHGIADFGMEEITGRATVSLPTAFAVKDNYPNPFNPSTTVRYDIPEASTVSLIIYDVMGREVRRLVDGIIEPGYHSVLWDARNTSGDEVSSGVYIYRFTARPVSEESTTEGLHYVKKMIYAK
jgi:subtilisin family serine protease